MDNKKLILVPSDLYESLNKDIPKEELQKYFQRKEIQSEKVKKTKKKSETARETASKIIKEIENAPKESFARQLLESIRAKS